MYCFIRQSYQQLVVIASAIKVKHNYFVLWEFITVIAIVVVITSTHTINRATITTNFADVIIIITATA